MTAPAPGPEALPGAMLEVIGHSEATDILDSLCGGARPWCEGTLLMATGEAGVTWGKWSEDRGWVLGSEINPTLCPPVSPATLLEARVFDGEEEILLWPGSDRRLAGRRLSDGATPEGAHLWLGEEGLELWVDRGWMLAADRCYGDPTDGFTLVGRRDGNRLLVPMEVADLRDHHLALDARSYLACDTRTGAARLAATRLVGLRLAEGSTKEGLA